MRYFDLTWKTNFVLKELNLKLIKHNNNVTKHNNRKS